MSPKQYTKLLAEITRLTRELSTVDADTLAALSPDQLATFRDNAVHARNFLRAAYAMFEWD